MRRNLLCAPRLAVWTSTDCVLRCTCKMWDPPHTVLVQVVSCCADFLAIDQGRASPSYGRRKYCAASNAVLFSFSCLDVLHYAVRRFPSRGRRTLCSKEWSLRAANISTPSGTLTVTCSARRGSHLFPQWRSSPCTQTQLSAELELGQPYDSGWKLPANSTVDTEQCTAHVCGHHCALSLRRFNGLTLVAVPYSPGALV